MAVATFALVRTSSELHERSKASLEMELFIVREIVLAHGGPITWPRRSGHRVLDPPSARTD